ncbi:hypothetical protein P9386_10540 [Caldifermentibacillus hisashii]|uniref:hypothetical protein n=1 Tax=Caldifermentibacillus hisashii TaxID=996558 RepID=UPI002E20530C|nr:hypothetical protein [Caldifermentibacillus hisashii]
MTDKERLEEIKEKYMEHEYDFNLIKNDINWLIEQAERVQDLKIMLKVLGEENQRFKKALEFYADPMIWREGNRIKDNTFEMPLANNDNGHKARKALE